MGEKSASAEIKAAGEQAITQTWQAKQYQRTTQLLLNAYGDEIHRYCLSMVVDSHDADEVSQIIFVQAYRDMHRFDQRSSFRTWLYAIARHRCLDWIKVKRRREKRFTLVDELPEVPIVDASTDNLDQNKLRQLLVACLELLSPTIRTAVLLRHQMEYSYEEMADIAGEKPGTLQARVVRALPKLRQCLEGKGVWQ